MRDDKAELAEELDLQDFLERESLAYKGPMRGSSGIQLNVRVCPNCGNSNYKTYISAEKSEGFIGNCFKCEAKFTKLGFVHQVFGRDLTSRTDWRQTYDDIRNILKEQGWRPKRVVETAVASEKATLPKSFPLPTPDGRNLIYLENRGITADYSRYFHLHYCERGTWNFTNDDGTPGYQRFDNRVIIPVYDLDGEFVTFQGRDITGLVGDKKYLFPKGLPGTGRYLLNGQSAWRARRVVMGEGGFDVIAIKKAFDEEPSLRDVIPIGSFGKHLSYGSMDGNDQLGRFLQLKAAGLEEVTIMWDGEVKALVAALDAGELLTQVGIRVRIALLPFEKDPNEVSPITVREAFWKAEPYTKLLNVRWRLRNPYAAAA